MSTQFNNVADAAAQFADDPKIAQEVRDEVKASELLFTLITMRIAKGLTQEQIAKSMGCNASKVSRIESGTGRDLKWSDVIGYVDALPDVHMGILFDDQSLSPAARIKQCVFKIDDDLKRLAQMAQQFDGDDQMAGKINKFYKEVLFNFLKRFAENEERLSNFVSVRPKDDLALSKSTTSEQCEKGSAYPVVE